MRRSDQAKLSVTSGWLALAIALLVAGCSHTTEGHPTASPNAGEAQPSLPIPPPTASLPTPAPPATPGGVTPLPANDNGYVFIETKSGKTRCQISSTSVGCESQFTDSPLKEGEYANGVSITAEGDFEWVLGNLGAIPTVTIEYATYQAQGWTVVASIEGTRFTNDRTGHGMFVSFDDVESF